MAENPPLNRIYVLGYSANDRDYPIVSLNADPRVAGYKVPEDLSTCPDKRYPNHVFTGAQPLSGDERVRHVWEILPSPWVPFTRYDDDLGPVQGRRRSVKNEGQVASLTADKRTTYEAREGSAIVYTELEETWSIKVDEDGNSLFPIKDRDFYDASRGPVQERRQLFVPTGEEVGSLENVNGIITQTSYEPYNDFLSVKIVQTYKVDGPQLIGKATDNDGQLVTVTTQRKGADGYVPPNPTATRTVEVSREDAEALIERIVDTPEVFKANTFSVERPDPIPQKFRVAVPIQSSQEIIEGTATIPTLQEGEISKSEEQRNKFIKRISTTSRDQAVLPKTLVGRATDNDRQQVTITETLQLGNTSEVPTATKTIESEALGDGNYVVRKTEIPEVFSGLTLSEERPDPLPQKFRVSIPISTEQKSVAGTAQKPVLGSGDLSGSEQQVNKFVKRVTSAKRNTDQLPKTLTQKTTTSEGLLATVTETLQSGDTFVLPTAKKTVESEAIGDGTYVVRITDAPEVFSAKTFRAEKADLTPQKFRAKQSDLTTEESVEGTASSPTLGENEFLKSEQQINKFVKRVVTNKRTTEISESLDESVITPEGQLATRKITLSKSAQTLSPSATLVDGNIEELGDGRTVKTEIKVDEVFDGKQESLEKPEVIPPEFRASLQNKTTSEIRAGQSSAITGLTQDELSKTVQRITEHKIRETRVTRPTTNYPSLTGQLVDNDLVKVTRTRTVAKGTQTITPSATVSGTVEALGDGYTLKTEDVKSKTFDSKQETINQVTQIPSKFLDGKISEKSETIQSQVATTDSVGSGGFGIVQSSAQRINEFLVRKTKREQEGVTSLTEYQTNNYNQRVTVTSTITDDPSVAIGATTEFARTQAIGGGKYVKEIGTVDSIFAETAKTRRQGAQLPQAFIDQQTTFSRVEEGTSDEPEAISTGGTGIVESSAQRITENRVRKSNTAIEAKSQTITTQVFTQDLGGGIATLTQKINDTIDPSFGTISAEETAIGGGVTVSRELVLANPPTLAGEEYDEVASIQIPFTQKFIEAGEEGELGSSITPRDVFHSQKRTIDVEAARNAYLEYQIITDDVVTLNLPDVLEDIKITARKIEGGQNATSSGNSSQAQCTASADWEIAVQTSVKSDFSGPVPALKYIFFIDPEKSSTIGKRTVDSGFVNVGKYTIPVGTIIERTKSKPWPYFRPKSQSFNIIVESERVSGSVAVSLPNNKSESTSNEKNVRIQTVSLPFCLNRAISLTNGESFEVSKKAKAEGPDVKAEVDVKAKAEYKIEGGEIVQTVPDGIPNGSYLYSVNTQLYRFGLVKVEATVVKLQGAVQTT